jgi:hypothetical protein
MRRWNTFNKAALFLLLSLALPILLVVGAQDAYALGHYGIPGTVDGCDECHDFAGGFYDDAGSGNLRWVKPTINSRSVVFTSFGTPPGTLADGNDANLDGPCEVCHTTTKYHTNTGDGTTHFDGTNCILCHPHFLDDITNYFEPRFVGTQSHVTHFSDPKGPLFEVKRPDDFCTFYCHDAGDFERFKDGELLADTNVCDDCHSAGGAFNGVSDAKAKWEDGVYKKNGYELKAGNEGWCGTCHDGGTSVVDGVTAPNVMGDNVTYGYNISGHGNDPLNYITCDGCHDFAVSHTDGRARTYKASSTNPNRSYRSGYRLNDDMSIPRNGEGAPTAFKLCTNCHVYSEITSRLKTNFRDDLKNTTFSYHENHLEWYNYFLCWDSDFDGTGPSEGYNVADSAMSCPACHNVHGSPTPAMIRHGELIGHVPALDFRWYEADGTTVTTTFEDSLYGALECANVPNLAHNHVCFGCHSVLPPNPTLIKYYRAPGGPVTLIVKNVWTTTLSDIVRDTFAVGEDIRYHVSFTISGGGSYYIKSPGKQSQAFETSGANWKTKLPKTGTLSAGDYEWTWDEAIPPEASPGSGARVKILLKMFDGPGGTLLTKDSMSHDFSIAP